jgi:uncharacterized repeat protein (TIGR03987 family)
MNPLAILIINLALVFYSIGVWSERIQGRLKVWHTVFFYLGLICDTWGTGMMFDYVGGMSWDIHGVSGVLAIALMFIHAIWATVVLVKKDEKMIVGFHKFSIFVWVIWLIPYFSPMVFQMVEQSEINLMCLIRAVIH